MSESTRQLQELLTYLKARYQAIPETGIHTDYAQTLLFLIGTTAERLEESKEMDLDKSFDRC